MRPVFSRVHASAQRAVGHPSARQRGIAFLIVIWVIALVSILLGSFAVIARTEGMQARHLLDGTRARYAAEAGISLAAYALSRRDPVKKWIPDGRAYKYHFNGAEVTIRVNAESGKISLNRASVKQLQRLFRIVGGLDQPKAQQMAARVKDWRDRDRNITVNGAEKSAYEQAGLSYGPANGPFLTVGSLQRVLGMTWELYKKVEPAITVFSNAGRPNPMYAPREVLMTMTGMPAEAAQNLIDMRHHIPAGTPAGVSGLTLPDGTPLVASRGGVTYSIRSTARLPNGISTTLNATIRLGGASRGARPFVILRWREGKRSQESGP